MEEVFWKCVLEHVFVGLWGMRGGGYAKYRDSAKIVESLVNILLMVLTTYCDLCDC